MTKGNGNSDNPATYCFSKVWKFYKFGSLPACWRDGFHAVHGAGNRRRQRPKPCFGNERSEWQTAPSEEGENQAVKIKLNLV